MLLNKMKSRLLFATALAAGGAALPAYAETPVAVSIGAGTTGFGGELQVKTNDYLSFRGGYHHLGISHEDDYDGINYDGDLTFSNVSLIADLHPFKNSFVISAGAYIGDKKIEAIGSSATNVEIGGQVFTPEQAGILELNAEMDDVAPFAGLGFDTTFQGEGRWGFKLIAGAIFAGEPELTLVSRDGIFSDDPNFIALVEEERLEIQEELEDFEIIPVVEAGISFRF